MKDRKKIFKYILLSFLIISTSLVSLPGIATPRINMTEKLVLTLDDCIDRAINEDAARYQYQNNILLKRKIDLDAMRRGYDGAVVMKGLGERLFNDLPTYSSTYTEAQQLQIEINQLISSGESTTSTVVVEKQNLLDTKNSSLSTYATTYYPLIGVTTPTTIQQADIFRLYIKPYTTGMTGVYDIEAGINSYELSKDVVKNSISQGVRVLYDTLYGLYDNLAMLEKQYEIKDRQYRIAIASYLNGQTAEIDRVKAGIELDQQKVNIDILKRNIENVKLKIKQQIGVWTEQAVEFKPVRTDEKIKEPLPLDSYLSKAVDLRIEVITARSEMTAKGSIFETTKKYVSDSSTDWIEAQIAVREKTAALDDAKKSVEQDITSGYNDVFEKKEGIVIAKQKVENADVQYNLAKKQYEQGFITESMLWNAEMGCIAAKAAYQKALRDYDTALYKLEHASGFGPAYGGTTRIGGR